MNVGSCVSVLLFQFTEEPGKPVVRFDMILRVVETLRSSQTASRFVTAGVVRYMLTGLREGYRATSSCIEHKYVHIIPIHTVVVVVVVWGI